jgi:putative sterol carrier protein
MTAKDFLIGLSSKLKPEDIGDVNTIIHFDLKGESYTLKVADGKADFSEGLNGESEVTLTASPDDLVKIATGETNPMMAMMMGKLKISNPGAMMKYAKMLGLM